MKNGRKQAMTMNTHHEAIKVSYWELESMQLSIAVFTYFFYTL